MLLLNPNQIHFIIVHHTAVSRVANTNQFDAIKRNHIARGWGDIGYHYLIEPDGTLKHGRDEKFVGAHASATRDGISMNRQSLSICLAGNFEIENPTKEQIDTLEDILKVLRKERNIPKENVLGHLEVPAATLCPGKNLLAYIRTYRARTDMHTTDNASVILDEIIGVLRRRGRID